MNSLHKTGVPCVLHFSPFYTPLSSPSLFWGALQHFYSAVFHTGGSCLPHKEYSVAHYSFLSPSGFLITHFPPFSMSFYSFFLIFKGSVCLHHIFLQFQNLLYFLPLPQYLHISIPLFTASHYSAFQSWWGLCIFLNRVHYFLPSPSSGILCVSSISPSR